MTETKFTPGPWVAEPSHASLDPVICMVAGLVVCCKDTDPNKVANAHLIAAAPELYEILDSIVSEHDSGGVVFASIGHARRALAKARGEAA